MERFFLSPKISQNELRKLTTIMGRFYSKNEDLEYKDCLKRVVDQVYKSMSKDLITDREKLIYKTKNTKEEKRSKEKKTISKNQIRGFINPKKVLFVTTYRCVKIPYNAPSIFRKIMSLVMEDDKLLARCKQDFFWDGCCCRTAILGDYYAKLEDLSEEEIKENKIFFFRKKKYTKRKVTHVFEEFQQMVNLTCLNHENR